MVVHLRAETSTAGRPCSLAPVPQRAYRIEQPGYAQAVRSPLDDTPHRDLGPGITAGVHSGERARSHGQKNLHQLISVNGRHEPSRRHNRAVLMLIYDEIHHCELTTASSPSQNASSRTRAGGVDVLNINSALMHQVLTDRCIISLPAWLRRTSCLFERLSGSGVSRQHG